MYSTTRQHKGFDHLETATRNIDSWPIWKKELAGIACSLENSTTNQDNTPSTRLCSKSNREQKK